MPNAQNEQNIDEKDKLIGGEFTSENIKKIFSESYRYSAQGYIYKRPRRFKGHAFLY